MAMKIASASIKLNNIRSYIAANVDLQLTQRSAPRLYIQGPPGAGKSMIMEEICRENGWSQNPIGIGGVSPVISKVYIFSLFAIFEYNNFLLRQHFYQL